MKELLNSRIVKIFTIVLIGILFELSIYMNGFNSDFTVLFMLLSPVKFVLKIIPENHQSLVLGWIIFIISFSLVTFFFVKFYKFLKNKKWKTYLKQLFFLSIFYPIFICSIVVLTFLARESPEIISSIVIVLLLLLMFLLFPSIFVYNIIMIIKDKNYGISLSLISSVLFLLSIFI